MHTNTTGGPYDRAQPRKAPAGTSGPGCTTGKDIIAKILTNHWAQPSVLDGRPVIIDCMGEGCGFQSSHANLVGDDAIWSEHAYHVADLMEQSGIAETAGVAKAERLRLADKLEEEAAIRTSMNWLRWSDETNLGWTQAANHLRHPTATD
ncbi:hypothetical protein GCM10023063_16180 [Arthrobacter methylotrophus]